MISTQRDVDLANIFVLLGDSLSAGRDIVDTMDILVQSSTRFTAATEAGILLADSAGVLHVTASTNERTREIEEAQLGSSQGPCLDCYLSGQAIGVSDISTEAARWPQFVALAQSRGFSAVHSAPLNVHGQTFGTLNLFSTGLVPFSDQDAALALALAQMATISVVQHKVLGDHKALTDQLRGALDSRILIEQAKGILAQRHGVPVDAAFSLLRNYARSTNSKLHDIADRIVNHGLAG